MTADRWQQIENVFNAVVRAPASEREALLRDVCEGDDELRLEVEGLVASHESGDPEQITLSLNPMLRAALEGNVFHEGQLIGAYRIVRRIGAGGMGQVFEALDLRLNRRVAIKVLSPAISADPEMVRRFEQEAQLASALNHPNILTVYDVGVWEGRRFLVTEFVEGETLRRRLRGSPMTEAEIKHVIHQAGSGLRAAHEAGILHRDMKPENLMLRPDGVVRILDFGLAKLAESTGFHTQVLVGTIPYMAPEQFRLERIDARADIFSLGVILYEIAAGHLPKSYPPPALPTQHARFDTVVRRAVDHDRDSRYGTVAEFLTDLEASRPTAVRLPWRVLGAIAGIVLLALVIWRAGQWRQPGEPELVRVTPLTTTGKTMRAAISANGQFLAYTLSEQNGQSLWVRQLAETSDFRLAHAFPDTSGLSFSNSGDYIYYSVRTAATYTLFRMPVMGGDPRRLANDVDTPTAPSPDDKQLAFIRMIKGTSFLVAVAVDGTGERIVAERVAPHRFRMAGPSWSPDGAWIATAAQDVVEGKPGVFIMLFPGNGGTPRILGPAWVDIDRVAWASDGLSLFVTGRAEANSSQLFRISTSTGERTRVTSDLSNFFDVTVQNGGEHVSAIRSDRSAYVSVGSPPRRLTTGATRYLDIAPAVNGLITISNASGSTEIWSIDNAGAERRLTSDGISKRDADACPGAGPLVFSSAAPGERSIWRADADGRNPRQLTKGSCCDDRPRCSPDGKTVLFQADRSGRISAWSVPVEGGAPKQLSEEVCIAPVWSPDGAQFACRYRAPETGQEYVIAVFPAFGGVRSRIVRGVPPTADFLWDHRGDALLYAQTEGNISSVWRHPIGAERGERVASFTDERIFDFVQRPTGELAFLRGTQGRDAVRISLVYR